MTDKEEFYKTSYEDFTYDFDFTDLIPPSTTSLTSATFSAFEWTGRSNRTATTSIFDSTTATIVSNLKARGRVKAGVDGYDYLIVCKAVGDDGTKLEQAAIMRVRDNT